ncbi:hypothetical protein OAH36_02390 [Verrucomicrobia bacterium]|jgi:hypothetical protein|nr:hypothetical protein [Verrucomicrobiota bacterium]MDB4746202.1 hypothetical protein [Verrucomicrobiota bacterium]MDB4798426.1 hypothetical protein [Verrucomicrobiota bacterium]
MVCKIVLPNAKDLRLYVVIVVMTADLEKIFWRICVSFQLTAAVLLLSLGAHSVAFHSWLHGEELDCSLTHHSPVRESSEEDSPEEQEHGDPLDPFCQMGHLLEFTLETPVFEQPRVVDSGLQHSIGFAFPRLFSSCPSRAPPVLI